MQAGTYGQWGALLAGGEVIYPTGYGTLVTAVSLLFVTYTYGSIVVLESLPIPKARNTTLFKNLHGLFCACNLHYVALQLNLGSSLVIVPRPTIP